MLYWWIWRDNRLTAAVWVTNHQSFSALTLSFGFMQTSCSKWPVMHRVGRQTLLISTLLQFDRTCCIIVLVFILTLVEWSNSDTVCGCMQVMRLVLDASRPSLELIASDTPQSYVDLMTKCWDQDPLSRPSAKQVSSLLLILLLELKVKTSIRRRLCTGVIEMGADGWLCSQRR